jgi:hypothetical protein
MDLPLLGMSLLYGPLETYKAGNTCVRQCVMYLFFSPGPPMQGNTNNYSGGAAVSAVPSMVKNDPTSTSSNVCKVIQACIF